MPRFARTLPWPLVLLSWAFGAGCLQDVSGEAVGAAARLYYPSQLALSSDGQSAFVVNTNFDQRFNAAWLTRVDVPALVAAGEASDAATADAAAWASLTQGPHVASLGGPLQLAEDGSRAYLAHRGLGLLTTLDVRRGADGRDAWRCDGGGRDGLSNRLKKTDCDAAHLLDVQLATAEQQGLADEPDRDDFLDPFALLALPEGRLGVAFLNTYRVAKLSPTLPMRVEEVLKAAEDVRIDDVAVVPGAILAAGRGGGDGFGGGGDSLLLSWADGAASPTRFAPSKAMGRAPERGERSPTLTRVLPAPDGSDRLFVLGRRPDTLSVMRLRRPTQSQIENDAVVVRKGPAVAELVHTEVLPDQALNALAYLTRPSGNLLVVSSFVRDTLYFFADLGDRLALVHRMRLPRGRGPAAMLPVRVAGRDYLLVSTFFDHGLSLLDVSTDDVADFRLQARVQDAQFPAQTRAR